MKSSLENDNITRKRGVFVCLLKVAPTHLDFVPPSKEDAPWLNDKRKPRAPAQLDDIISELAKKKVST